MVVSSRIRLLPGVIILALQMLIRFVVPIFAPEFAPMSFFGGLLGWLAIVIWWAFFSRAPRLERWGGAALMILALAATPLILHASIARAMYGLIFVMYATPILSLAFVTAVVITQSLTEVPRRAVIAAFIVLSCGLWALLRSDGMTGGDGAVFAWRWTPTAEERFLSQADETTPTGTLMSESTESGAHWPGFRGANRDGIVRGSQIETDWAANPPIELWRRAVGPGWSSFAVKGDLIYTQEQRGDDEVVVCYDLTTGSQVWQHTDGTRFWEAIGGPGPRGTPTLHGSRVYSFGANGTLNALNANDGTVIWSRDVADDAGVEIPMWGFSSSPLIVDDILIIAAAGTLAAYDLETGKTRWVGTHGGGGYSSPHQATLSGVTQVVITSSSGVAGVSPTDGKQLWKYAWAGDGIVQPAFTPEGDILMGSNAQAGRISVRHTSGRWAVEEHWSSNRLKPYFNDFVVHNDHAYGFDGRHLACIDIAEGERQWKGGRYGSGQLILLADQDLLLVTSEKGELALVSATPGGFKEVARVPAIEGKTWNHPVLVGDMLLIRNGEEMAAFRLSLVAGT